MDGRNDRWSLSLAAKLMLVGQILYIVVTQFHADGDANNHPLVFAEYASNGMWTAVHVAQFLAIAILLAGLLALFLALDAASIAARLSARFGAACAIVALALYGALQAVDGVANKQVDVAWASAAGAEKAARFASAEAVRWIEWGLRSYQDFAMGLALILLALAVIRSAAISRPIAYLIALSGIAYLAQGWIVGSQGFSGTESILIVLSWVLSLAWMIWLLVVARHRGDAAVLYES